MNSKNQNLNKSITQTLDYYISKEMYDESLEMLEKNSVIFSDTEYYTLKIKILKCLSDTKYLDVIIDTFTSYIQLTDDLKQISSLEIDQYICLVKINAPEEAMISLDKFIETINSFNLSDEEKNRFLIRFYEELCDSLNKTEMFEYAQKNSDALYVKIIPQFDDSVDQYTKDRFRTSRINLIEDKKIRNDIARNVKIPTELVLTYTDNNIKNNTDYMKISNLCFLSARLIRKSIFEKYSESITNLNNYYYYLSLGMLFSGVDTLSNDNQKHSINSARFFLLQSIKYIKNSSEHSSFYRGLILLYFNTFYESGKDISKNFALDKIEELNYDDETFTTNLCVLMSNSISNNISIHEFVIGILEFVTLLSSHTKELSSILYSYVNYNTEEISKILYDIINSEHNNSIDSLSEFIKLWDSAIRDYSKNKIELLDLIKSEISNMYSINLSRSNDLPFLDNKYAASLNAKDFYIVSEIQNIFIKSCSYTEISNYSSKLNLLHEIKESCISLITHIQSSPTELSYNNLRDNIESISSKTEKEIMKLYKYHKPFLSIRNSGQCKYHNTLSAVYIPISISNETNVQSADILLINISEDCTDINNDEIVKFSNERRILMVAASGETNEKLFIVHCKEKRKKELTLYVTIAYQYYISDTDVETHTQKFILTVSVNNAEIFKKIENKFEKHKNGAEVKDSSMFYGRDKDINNILSILKSNEGGKCIALYGQTRSGKSSLLYHIQQALRNESEIKYIIVNIGSIGEIALRDDYITDFLYSLLDALNYEIEDYHKELSRMLADKNICIDPEILNDNLENSQQLFNRVFKKITRFISKLNENYRIIILIDEFTYIYDWINKGQITDRIMSFWKAFTQNNNILSIVIGQDHMMKFISDSRFTNDFGATDLYKVTYLSESNAKKLMSEPIPDENGQSRYNAEALSRLYELTNGSAFLIMNICSGLVDYLNENEISYITRAHVDDYLQKNIVNFEESRFFESQYNDKSFFDNPEEANEKNKQIIKCIAQKSYNQDWVSIDEIVQSDDDKITLHNLEARDVVIISDNKCKIKVTLYKEWIIAKYGNGRE